VTAKEAAELVPGDRVDLEAGDRVPADVRLIHTAGFRAEEAALTGESVPADKDHDEVLEPDAPLGDRVNMAYMGTVAAAGTAGAIVAATGMNTRSATSPACSSGRASSRRRCSAGWPNWARRCCSGCSASSL
jgi:Ca2+-transporting ATPase